MRGEGGRGRVRGEGGRGRVGRGKEREVGGGKWREGEVGWEERVKEVESGGDNGQFL